MTGAHARMNEDALRADYVSDGFVSIAGFFDGEELRVLRNELSRVLRDIVPRMPREEVYLEDIEGPR